MNFNKTLVIVVLLFGSLMHSQVIENYNTDNSPLPSNQVNSITVVDNVIWFGTSEGLASFDGENWKIHDTELSSNRISSSSVILGAAESKLILGTISGTTSFSVNGLNITPPLSYINVSSDSIVSNNIISLTTWHDLNQWLGTENGISLVTPDSTVNIQIGDTGIKLNNNYINSLAVSVDTIRHKLEENYTPSSGVVYAATNGGGVSRFYLHQVDGISSASVVEDSWSGLPSDTVLAVYIDNKNYHWYGTPKGAAVHLEHNSKYANWSNYGIDDGLINNRVTAITSDNFANIWFGTIGGISKFDGENWLSITEADGLISNKVNDIKVDSEDVVWIATDKGISKLVSITSVEDNQNNLPQTYQLKLDAYPNPFNPTINFNLSINSPAQVQIQIFNINGELVNNLENRFLQSGTHSIQWKGKDNLNRQVHSGVYLVRVSSSQFSISKKIMLLK